MEHKLFKVNQNAILQNSERKVLVLRRDGRWMLPGGRLEEGEDWLDGLRREVKEETSIDNFIIERILHVDMSDSGETYIVTFLCRTDGDPHVALSHEHDEYAWITKEEVDTYTFRYDKLRDRIKSAQALV